MKLILENVRCFAGRHEHEIRPLTLLVGENSAGKSTFLAMLSAVSSPVGFPARPRFNDPPYNLGSFDTIATHKAGNNGHLWTFAIGYSIQPDDGRPGFNILATYEGRSGQVMLKTFEAENTTDNASLRFDHANGFYRGLVVCPDIEGEGPSVDEAIFDRLALSEIGSLAYTALVNSAFGTDQFIKVLVSSQKKWFQITTPSQAISLAPVRSKPKRTYDQAGEEYDPEGDDIPFLLDRIYEQKPSDERTTLISALNRFGQDSGLLKKLDVRKLGNKPSDPIQLYVTVSGRPANLPDVGYGVSQALPIVVRSVLLTDRRRLLLQQPEVHLHPKAQAALGSFFADLVASGSRQFVIETHSDYIIDRVRLEVARGKLKPELVSILYFERNGSETTIHEIEVDRLGNIVNAPPAYRSFFLNEELNLLTRAGK